MVATLVMAAAMVAVTLDVDAPVAMAMAMAMAVEVAVAVTLLAIVAVAVDAAHARTQATHKVAGSQPSHACNKRRLHASALSRLTKMPNRQAMSLQASRLPASLQAVTAVTTAVVVVVAAKVDLAAVVDVQVAEAKAVPATSARSTVVNNDTPANRAH